MYCILYKRDLLQWHQQMWCGVYSQTTPLFQTFTQCFMQCWRVICSYFGSGIFVWPTLFFFLLQFAWPTLKLINLSSHQGMAPSPGWQCVSNVNNIRLTVCQKTYLLWSVSSSLETEKKVKCSHALVLLEQSDAPCSCSQTAYPWQVY